MYHKGWYIMLIKIVKCFKIEIIIAIHKTSDIEVSIDTFKVHVYVIKNGYLGKLFIEAKKVQNIYVGIC